MLLVIKLVFYFKEGHKSARMMMIQEYRNDIGNFKEGHKTARMMVIQVYRNAIGN